MRDFADGSRDKDGDGRPADEVREYTALDFICGLFGRANTPPPRRITSREIPEREMPITELLFPPAQQPSKDSPGNGQVGFAFVPASGLFERPAQPSATASTNRGLSPTTAFLSPNEAASDTRRSSAENSLARRIASLESTIEYQNNSHAEQLKGLHEEVKRLQGVSNELALKLSASLNGEPLSPMDFPPDFGNLQTPSDLTIRQVSVHLLPCHRDGHRYYIVVDTLIVEAISTNAPVAFLLEGRRRLKSPHIICNRAAPFSKSLQ